MSEFKVYHTIRVALKTNDDDSRIIRAIADVDDGDYSYTVNVEATIGPGRVALTIVPLAVQEAFGRVMEHYGAGRQPMPEWPGEVELSVEPTEVGKRDTCEDKK